MMKKKRLILICMLGLLWLLGGCSFRFRSVGELFTLPKLPEEYQNLQSMIEEATKAGAEYSAPTNGENTQPVQLQDLDGDGTLEAIAFFKVSGSDKPLKIYIYRQTANGYEVGAVIESEGASIYSIDYKTLNGGKGKDIVVCWRTGSNSLEVYSLENYEVTKLMSTGYTDYKIMDIDMDNQEEILVLYVDTVDGTRSRVDCYDADKDALILRSSAPMSSGVSRAESVQGYLKGKTPVPALFVTSYYFEGSVTDILAWKDGELKNITLDSELGVSNSTYRIKDKATLTDINGDNYMEIPMPVKLPDADPASVTDAIVLYSWYQFDIDGKSYPVYTTYVNFIDGWYFILPSSWVGKVTVSQFSVSVEEQSTVFSYWQEGEEPQPFLTIYRLTGANRYMRAQTGERFVLKPGDSGDTTIYAAELIKGGWRCGLDEAGVEAQFKMRDLTVDVS